MQTDEMDILIFFYTKNSVLIEHLILKVIQHFQCSLDLVNILIL